MWFCNTPTFGPHKQHRKRSVLWPPPSGCVCQRLVRRGHPKRFPEPGGTQTSRGDGTVDPVAATGRLEMNSHGLRWLTLVLQHVVSNSSGPLQYMGWLSRYMKLSRLHLWHVVHWRPWWSMVINAVLLWCCGLLRRYPNTGSDKRFTIPTSSNQEAAARRRGSNRSSNNLRLYYSWRRIRTLSFLWNHRRV